MAKNNKIKFKNKINKYSRYFESVPPKTEEDKARRFFYVLSLDRTEAPGYNFGLSRKEKNKQVVYFTRHVI